MTLVSINDRTEVQDVDITEVMRKGHPFIHEGDEYIIALVEQHCQRLGRSVRVLEIGCGTGVFSEMLAERVSGAKVVANEPDPSVVPLAQHRLASSSAELFLGQFEEWTEPLDIFISWGAHHHLPKHYLDHAKHLLSPDGIVILGDEFCPEYCNVEDTAKIAKAEVIHIADGLVLTSTEEVELYHKEGRVPQRVLDLEQRRQRMLWNWYKYVIDYAMNHGYMNVALTELQIALDDLTTRFGGEHKLSPLFTERDLELRGFRRLSKRAFGPKAVEFQSFFIYEFAVEDEPHVSRDPLSLPVT